MTIYFCINEVLDVLENIKDEDSWSTSLIPVYVHEPDHIEHIEDIFMLSSSPKLLYLHSEDAPSQLATLVEAVPLYQINLELVLDEILAERHNNALIQKILEPIFANEPMPDTLERPQKDENSPEGGLRHPVLAHMDKAELCRIYLSFLKEYRSFPETKGNDQDVYGFERRILGKQTERFFEYFGGFIFSFTGKIKSDIAIGFGIRADHELHKAEPIDSYVETGRKKAASMKITEPRELLLAWLEADRYQMRRCRDINRLLTMKNLPRIPNWLRTDTLKLIEKEAMKQRFALRIVDSDAVLTDNMPKVGEAVKAGADGKVDDLLQRLVSEIFTPGSGYSGTAGKFLEMAAVREKEAQQHMEITSRSELSA